MSLLLPMTAWLIEFELSPSVDITLANNTIIEHKDLLPAGKEGRSAMHADFVKRWVTDLNESILEDYTVSTLLDPRWKNWQFDGCNIFLAATITTQNPKRDCDD
eukprot:gene14480-17119_t